MASMGGKNFTLNVGYDEWFYYTAKCGIDRVVNNHTDGQQHCEHREGIALELLETIGRKLDWHINWIQLDGADLTRRTARSMHEFYRNYAEFNHNLKRYLERNGTVDTMSYLFFGPAPGSVRTGHHHLRQSVQMPTTGSFAIVASRSLADHTMVHRLPRYVAQWLKQWAVYSLGSWLMLIAILMVVIIIISSIVIKATDRKLTAWQLIHGLIPGQGGPYALRSVHGVGRKMAFTILSLMCLFAAGIYTDIIVIGKTMPTTDACPFCLDTLAHMVRNKEAKLVFSAPFYFIEYLEYKSSTVDTVGRKQCDHMTLLELFKEDKVTPRKDYARMEQIIDEINANKAAMIVVE